MPAIRFEAYCYHSICRRYFVTSAICWFAAEATAYCWTRVIWTRHVLEYQEVRVYPVWSEVSVSLLLVKKHKGWWYSLGGLMPLSCVWLRASRQFKIDLTHCKKSFFRAVNSLFSKVLRIAICQWRDYVALNIDEMCADLAVWTWRLPT